MKVATSRRSFLKSALGALGWTMLPGGRLWAAPPGWVHSGKPNLTFGIVSDTHIRSNWKGTMGRGSWTRKYFQAALECFRKCNVDAVVHCGDMAHRGQIVEMQAHADVWFDVFPGNKAPDGHTVEKLFVLGNHDTEGGDMVGFVDTIFPDPEERAKHLIITDPAATWEKVWKESYAPVWHKVVKGYHFFGRHYHIDEMNTVPVVDALKDQIAGEGVTKPFFVVSHRRTHFALHKAFQPYKNAVGLFGHWHQSATNWNIIKFWGSSFPHIQVPSCEPRGCKALVDDAYIAQAPLEGMDGAGASYQGYVIRIYDDMMVVHRREFGVDGGGSLGAPWVMPFGCYEPNPLSVDELKKHIGKPEFSAGAELSVNDSTWRSEDGKEEKPAIRVTIPPARGNRNCRVYAYDVVVASGGKKLVKSVYAAGCNLAMGKEPNGGVTYLLIPKDELPAAGDCMVAARPLSSLGTSGKPIGAKFSNKICGGAVKMWYNTHICKK